MIMSFIPKNKLILLSPCKCMLRIRTSTLCNARRNQFSSMAKFEKKIHGQRQEHKRIIQQRFKSDLLDKNQDKNVHNVTSEVRDEKTIEESTNMILEEENALARLSGYDEELNHCEEEFSQKHDQIWEEESLDNNSYFGSSEIDNGHKMSDEEREKFLRITEKLKNVVDPSDLFEKKARQEQPYSSSLDILQEHLNSSNDVLSLTSIAVNLETISNEGNQKTLVQRESFIKDFVEPCIQENLKLETVQTLVPLVKKSKVLTNLVNMGVDLNKFESKSKVAARKLLNITWEEGVIPVLRFYKVLGIPDWSLAAVITDFPEVFCHDIDDLQVRIDYFKSKKFSNQLLTEMILNGPFILGLNIVNIDMQLGYLQKHFQTSAKNLRIAVSRHPLLITQPKKKILEKRIFLRTQVNWTKDDLQQVLVNCPRIFVPLEMKTLRTNYNYAHFMLKYPHELLMTFPDILCMDCHSLRERHQFLLSMERAQFDPKKENYISPQSFTKPLEEFCVSVAKSSLDCYVKFLKTYS